MKKARLLKDRKAVYYRELTYTAPGTVHTHDCYDIFKGAMPIEEAKRQGLMDYGEYNNLSYAEKQRIAKTTVIE